MLGIKPVRRIVAGESEISILPKPPQNVAAPCAVLVVDLEDPTLVAHRQEKVTIGRVVDGIAVRPIGQSLKMAIQV
jgi:hypothetical protein